MNNTEFASPFFGLDCVLLTISTRFDGRIIRVDHAQDNRPVGNSYRGAYGGRGGYINSAGRGDNSGTYQPMQGRHGDPSMGAFGGRGGQHGQYGGRGQYGGQGPTGGNSYH